MYIAIQVNSAITEAIEILFKEDAIRLVYDLRATTKISESSAYFWDEIKRIAAPDYIPTTKDTLLVRYRTTGTQYIFDFNYCLHLIVILLYRCLRNEI